jgi:hypothetical protein
MPVESLSFDLEALDRKVERLRVGTQFRWML